jgi:hypothetical protein
LKAKTFNGGGKRNSLIMAYACNGIFCSYENYEYEHHIEMLGFSNVMCSKSSIMAPCKLRKDL